MRQWAEGGTGDPLLGRTRTAARRVRAASLVAEADSQRVAQAWFQGLNPMLDDQSPARLREASDQEKAGARVLASARQFAAVGWARVGIHEDAPTDIGPVTVARVRRQMVYRVGFGPRRGSGRRGTSPSPGLRQPLG